MNNDGSQTLRAFLLRLLLPPAVLAGIALTWGAAWVGLTIATAPTFVPSKLSTARVRVKAARDATAQYMLDNAGDCPRAIDELIWRKYLDRNNAKDPWGGSLILHCPASSDSPDADVLSAGPDKQEGTPDDIKSWELQPRVVSGRATAPSRSPGVVYVKTRYKIPRCSSSES